MNKEMDNNNNVLNFLLLLVPIYLGRIQEMVPFLHHLYLAKITMGMALLIFFLSFDRYSEGNAVLSKIPQAKYIVLIFIMAVLSIPFSYWPGGSFNYIVSNYVKLLLFVFLLVWCINTEEELLKICWAFAGTVLLINIVGLVNPSEIRGRIFVGSTYDPNDMALLLVVALPLLFSMMENTAGWKKLLLMVAMLTSLVMILRTGSRGGLVALVSVLGMVSYQKGLAYLLKRLPILLVLLFVVLGFASAVQMERLETIFSMGEDYNTTQQGGRLEIWKRGISIMFRNPFLGCGIDQFIIANGKMADGTWHTAHNSFIQIGAELGVTGLLLFVLLISSSIRSLKDKEGILEKIWLVRGIRTGLYGFCIGGFFLSWAYSYVTYFLVAISIIVQKISLNKEYAHANQAEK